MPKYPAKVPAGMGVSQEVYNEWKKQKEAEESGVAAEMQSGSSAMERAQGIRAPTWGEANPGWSQTIQSIPKMVLGSLGIAAGAAAGGPTVLGVPAAAAAGGIGGEALGTGIQMEMKRARPDLFGDPRAYSAGEQIVDAGMDLGLQAVPPALRMGGAAFMKGILGRSAVDPHVQEAFKWFLTKGKGSAPIPAILSEHSSLGKILRNSAITNQKPIDAAYTTAREEAEAFANKQMSKYVAKTARGSDPIPVATRVSEDLQSAHASSKANVDAAYDLFKDTIEKVTEKGPGGETIVAPIKFTKIDAALRKVLNDPKLDPNIRKLVVDMHLDEPTKLIDSFKQMYSKYLPALGTNASVADTLKRTITAYDTLTKGGSIGYSTLEILRKDINDAVRDLGKQNLTKGTVATFRGQLKAIAGALKTAGQEGLKNDPRYAADAPDLLRQADELFKQHSSVFPKDSKIIQNLLTSKKRVGTTNINHADELKKVFKNQQVSGMVVEALGKRNKPLNAALRKDLFEQAWIEDTRSASGGYYSGSKLLSGMNQIQNGIGKILTSDEKAAYKNLAVVFDRLNNTQTNTMVGSQAGLFLQGNLLGKLAIGGLLAAAVDKPFFTAAVGGGMIGLTGITLGRNQLSKFAINPQNARLLAKVLTTPASNPASKSLMRRLIAGAAGKGIRLSAQHINGDTREYYVDESGKLVPYENEFPEE